MQQVLILVQRVEHNVYLVALELLPMILALWVVSIAPLVRIKEVRDSRIAYCVHLALPLQSCMLYRALLVLLVILQQTMVL